MAKLSFIILIICCTTLCKGQQDENTKVEYHPSVWLEGAIGPIGQQFGYEVTFNFNTGKKTFLTIGYDRALHIFTDVARPRSEAGALSVRFGGLKKKRPFQLQYSAGLSWIEGTHHSYGPNYQRLRDHFSTIGLTGEAGVILSPNYIGLGLGVFVQVSKEYSYQGFTLSLAVGSLNNRKKSSKQN